MYFGICSFACRNHLPRIGHARKSFREQTGKHQSGNYGGADRCNQWHYLFTGHFHSQQPCVADDRAVYFPGGGFTSADYEKFIEMRMALAKAGFVVAAAEYRTVPDKFPALVIDGKAAVRFLRAHAAQFGIDPTRIGVIGDSAGGYLSQMVGTTNGEKEFDQGDYLDQSSDVQAAVTIYGISNLLNIGEGYSDAIQQVHASPAVTEALLVHGPAFADFAGASILSDPEKAMKASPLGHVKEHMPPFLIMHGSNDRLVSPVQSEQLFKALTEKGNQATYVTVEGAGHGDLYWFQQPVIERVVSWFQTVFQYHTDK